MVDQRPYWLVSDDKYGVTHMSRVAIEDFDEFFEYVTNLQKLGFLNIRVYDHVDLGEPIMRFDDE